MCQCSCSSERYSQPPRSAQSDCCCNTGFHRRYIAPAEEKAKLEYYKEALQNELAGVDARLKELSE